MSEPYLTLPPTQDELPYDDGVPMETYRHNQQMHLLIETLKPWLDDRYPGGSFVGGNMFVYYSLSQVRNQDFKGPDVFVALDVDRERDRKSWVVWEEGKSPDLIIELLSPSTASYDKTVKKRIYQDQLRVDEYYWYDPYNPVDLAGFKRVNGIFQPLEPDAEGHLPSPRLGLLLVRWSGVYLGTEAIWLRWATPEAQLLLTEREQREQVQTRAEQVQEQLDSERQRAEAAEAELARLKQLLEDKHAGNS
jgi:Uma2 family endonuclease